MSPAFHPAPPSLQPIRTARPRPRQPLCMRTSTPPLSPLLPAAAAAAILLASTVRAAPPTAPPARVHAAEAAPVSRAPPLPAAPRVLDYGRVLTSGEASRLSSRLSALQAATSLRVRVVTQALRPSGAGATIRWPIPPADTVVIAVDPAAGNALSFSVGELVYSRLPASFWLEAGNRFGNAFYVRENGLDVALFAVVDAIEECAAPGRFCRAVPGVSEDQWKISVVCASIAGGVVGAAARTGGKRFNAGFVLLFSPLWSIFLISFGVGPIISRGPGVEIQLASTVAAFVLLAAVVWWWVPVRFGPPGKDGTTNA